MSIKLFAFITLVLCGGAVSMQTFNMPPSKYAVLVAGSSSYYNFRHQADIAHAYKNLIRHGVPHDNIIVMMYDDIARSEVNPGYNNLVNRPYSENVYKGIRVDYRYKEVTPHIFMAVLSGNRTILRNVGSGRYVEATENDNVLIYMSDHGATGLFGFPNDNLYADQMIDALKKLKSRVNKVLVLMEACESGSMFSGYLEDKSGIMAITASNPYESSYAYYHSYKYSAFLGDEFSINFLEYLEKADPKTTKISDLIQVVKIQTKHSHVQVYGDFSMDQLYLNEFFGGLQEYNLSPSKESQVSYNHSYAETEATEPTTTDYITIYHSDSDEPQDDSNLSKPVKSQYVQRTLSKQKLLKDPEDKEALKLLNTESKIEMVFDQVSDKFNDIIEKSSRLRKENGDNHPVFYGNLRKCYQHAIEHFNKVCFSPKEYNLVYSYYNVLYNLCAGKVPLREIKATLNEFCEKV